MIYVVVPNFNVSGGIKVGCQWVRSLIARGYEAAVVTPVRDECPEWLGFHVPTLGYRDMQNSPDHKVVHVWLDCLKELGEAMDDADTYYFAQDAAQPLYVETRPGRFEEEYLPRLRRCKLITVSHATRRWHLHRYGLKSQVVHNWVDDSLFFSAETQEANEICMIRHRDHFNQAVFDALRDDGYRIAIAEGPQESVASTFRESIVFVSCARGRPDGWELSEGLPMPIMEAMACGCAPICPDTNGVRDMIIPGLNGFLLENADGIADNPLAYVAAAHAAFDHGNLIGICGSHAPRTIERGFSRESGEGAMLRALDLEYGG